MATPFEDIIDMAMGNMKDYKLDAIYKTDPDLFEDIMTQHVIRGSIQFESCMQSLDFDLSAKQFNSTLTMSEIVILSDLAILDWYTYELNDVLEFKEPLRDSDFNRYSTGQNIRPRQEEIDNKRRRIKQNITNYLFNEDNILSAFQEGMGYV